MPGIGLGLGIGETQTRVAAESGENEVIFAMDYSLAEVPTAGFSTVNDPDTTNLTRAPAGGSAGNDAYDVEFVSTGPSGVQFGFGWARILTHDQFDYGGNIFMRWRYRHVSGFNGRCYSDDGLGNLSGIGRLKFLTTNDHAPTSGRPILSIWVNRDPLLYQWRWDKGGGVDPAVSDYLSVDNDWHAMQVELQYSSAVDVADGAYRIWRDGILLAQSENIVLNATDQGDPVLPGYLKFGYYFNHGLYSDGVWTTRIEEFSVNTQFDENW